MNSLRTTVLAILLFIAQNIGATGSTSSLPDAIEDYYVIVLPPTMANGCKIYQVRIYHRNGTPLDRSDDTLVASGAIEDCPGNEINSDEYIGTLDNIIELPDCEGAVISIYSNQGMEFIVKGTVPIGCSEE